MCESMIVTNVKTCENYSRVIPIMLQLAWNCAGKIYSHGGTLILVHTSCWGIETCQFELLPTSRPETSYIFWICWCTRQLSGGWTSWCRTVYFEYVQLQPSKFTFLTYSILIVVAADRNLYCCLKNVNLMKCAHTTFSSFSLFSFLYDSNHQCSCHRNCDETSHDADNSSSADFA